MILNGDCLEELRKMDADSVDSMVTDPPYGWRFMGKAWDVMDIDKLAKQGKRHGDTFVGADGRIRKTRNQTAEAAEKYDLSLSSNQAFQKWTEEWAREVYRVLKPGAHILVFCGPRTYHRMASGVEDAGFEVRDQMQWLFGSGFPKSMDISKAIDKTAGAEREVIGDNPNKRPNSQLNYSLDGKAKNFSIDVQPITAPATDAAKQWQGWGTALKPANEPILLARKPCSEKTVAANVLKHGTGGINIDASRVGTTNKLVRPEIKRLNNNVLGKGLGAGAQSEPQGRFPSNTILSHNDDCVEVGVKKVKGAGGGQAQHTETSAFTNTYGDFSGRSAINHTDLDGTETVSAFECTDGCAVTGLNIQAQQEVNRYFYCAKASKRERNEGCEGLPEKEKKTLNDYVKPSEGRTASKSGAPASNHHPTVKPIKLMSYLITMITPPNGIVLDPFMGSGSTGVAAVQSGFQFIGIEKELEYFQIAEKRLDHGRNRQEDKDCTVSHSQESSMEGL